MNLQRRGSTALIAATIALAAAASFNASAQAPGLVVKPLLRTTLAGDDTKESVKGKPITQPVAK